MSLEQQLVIEENFTKAFHKDSLRQSLSATDFEKYESALKVLEFAKGDVVCSEKA